MCTVTFNIPNKFLSERRIATDEASAYARLMFAVGVFKSGGMTIEDAAELAATDVQSFRDLVFAEEATDEDKSWLMAELERGSSSQTWYTEEEMDKHFQRRRAELLQIGRAHV